MSIQEFLLGVIFGIAITVTFFTMRSGSTRKTQRRFRTYEENIQEAIEHAVENEDYIRAAEFRDRLQKHHNRQTK